MEYFYTDGVTNFGPFSLEQLHEKNITPSTKIWYSGLSGWTAAGELPELSGILGSTPINIPPPVTTHPPQYSTSPGINYMQNKPPKTWLVESILVTLFCCLPFGIAGIIFASRVESKFYAGDTQGAMTASQEAGKWTRIGFFIGLGIAIIYVIYILAIVFWAAKNGSDFDRFAPNF